LSYQEVGAGETKRPREYGRNPLEGRGGETRSSLTESKWKKKKVLSDDEKTLVFPHGLDWAHQESRKKKKRGIYFAG